MLLYVDSRGTNIPNHYEYKHYDSKLLKSVNVDAYLCPEKWTTILDFLLMWEKNKFKKFDFVILHAGVVDASPRPQKIMLETIYPEKERFFNEIFGKSLIQQYLHTDLNCEYEGDKTINMYSLEMCEKFLIPRLFDVPNLIWVGINKVDPSWHGNYWKERPRNIHIIESYSRLIANKLPNVIDLLNLWQISEIRENTFDNIHPNKKGSDFIFNEIMSHLIGEKVSKC